MPLASRSLASSRERKSLASPDSARSSSSSASWPSANTPPSRSTVGGLSTIARASSAAAAAGSDSTSTKWRSGSPSRASSASAPSVRALSAGGGPSASSRREISGNTSRLTLRRSSSRGWTEPSCTRVTMRSMSCTRAIRGRSDSARSRPSRAATRAWRVAISARSRTGRCSQSRRRRAPIGQLVRSTTPRRVWARTPPALSTISR